MEQRRLKTFREFTKTNENLEFEENTPDGSASSSGTATAEAQPEKDETLDFGEGESNTATDTEQKAPDGATTDTEVKNKDLVAKLGHMIAILNSHRSYLKSEDADENLIKKVNSLFGEFNKY